MCWFRHCARKPACRFGRQAIACLPGIASFYRQQPQGFAGRQCDGLHAGDFPRRPFHAGAAASARGRGGVGDHAARCRHVVERVSTQSSKPLSFTAIRSILGEVVEALHVLQKDNLTHFSISTDTVRLTRNGIEIADAPVSIMLADTSRVQSVENQEQLAIRQVASCCIPC